MGLPKRYSSLYQLQLYTILGIVIFTIISAIYLNVYDRIDTSATSLIMQIVRYYPWLIIQFADVPFYIFVRYERVQRFNAANYPFIDETIGTRP